MDRKRCNMVSTGFVYEFTVPAEWGGRELKSILKSELKLSTRMFRSMAPYQGVTRNGTPVFVKGPVEAGDKIVFVLPRESTELPSENIPLDICYEDAEIVVVNKPPGMLAHPTAREREGTLLAAVLHHVAAEGAVPHCVHRLDRDTSGTLMLAKHAYVHHLFDLALRSGHMHRSYCALVWHGDAFSMPEVGEWETIDLPIAANPNQPSRRMIHGSGQRAITHYSVIAQTSDVSLLYIRLETGRTHQIRLHCSTVGLPLVGDQSYGRAPSYTRNSKALSFPRQALHAVHLDWIHPVSKASHRATAPVAADIKLLWKELGGSEEVWPMIEQGHIQPHR